MKIIAGAWKGKILSAPAGSETRPTNIRARQALFDMLAHAPWAGDGLRGAKILDVFAGTGAFGLEALSRGAAASVFFEQSPAALAALRANIAACKAEDSCRVIAGDVLVAPAGTPHDLVFLDPPYGQDLIPRAVVHLHARGWIAPGALIIGEFGPGDLFETSNILAERAHGKARLAVWRL